MSIALSEQALKERKAQRLKNLRNTALGVAAAITVGAGLWTGAAIDRVPEGTFGVARSVSGHYKDQVINPGLSVNYLTSVMKVDSKSNTIDLRDLRPKTAEGPRLKHINVNIIYNVNPQGAVPFLREVNDVMLQTDGTYVMGRTMITNMANSVITGVISQNSAVELVGDASRIEGLAVNQLQAALNKAYGKGLFEIVAIKMTNTGLDDAIEQRIAAVAAQEASRALAEAQMSTLQVRQEAEKAEAAALVNISKETGVSMSDLIELRRIRTLGDMPAGTVQATMQADRKPAP